MPNVYIDETSWSWWTRERIVWLNGYTWVGSVDCSGHIWVHVIADSDLTVGSVRAEKREADDHNNPALVLAAGKAPLIFFARHQFDNEVRVIKGSDTADNGLRALLASATTATFAGTTTYAQAHADGDTVHLWTRDASRYWDVVASTDWAGTWGTPVRVFDGGAGQFLYMPTAQVDGVARCLMAHHPEMTLHPLYYGEVDYSTGDVTAGDGVSLANLDGTNLPLAYNALELVRQPAAGLRSWAFDVGTGATPEGTSIEFDDTDIPGTAMYLWHKRLGNDNWITKEIVAAGDKFGLNDDGAYFGGAQLGEPGQVFLTRKVGAEWRAEIWTTDDDGDTWATEVLLTSSNILARMWPAPPESPFRAVVSEITHWGTGPDDTNAFKDFDGRLVLIP